MHYEELEQMLLCDDEYKKPAELNNFNEIKNGIYDSKQLKSDKSASLFDFIKMIDKIITLTMNDIDVEFIPDEGKIVYLANDFKLDHPIITYKIISRIPKNELKPRFRESFKEDKDSTNSRFGEIYGQKFKCNIQFNIFASTYKSVEEILERFETMMICYTGFFKRNGVGELLFDKQHTDESFQNLRQTLSIRNICYYVEIEKVTVIMRENIKEIDITS